VDVLQVEAPIEPPLELGEIARHVFRTNRAMHAEHVALDVCEHCIDPEELWPARRFPAAARFDRQMHDLAGRGKRAEAREPVGRTSLCPQSGASWERAGEMTGTAIVI